MPPKWQGEAYEGLPIYQATDTNLQRSQISPALVYIFGNTWHKRIVAKQEHYQFNASADELI